MHHLHIWTFLLYFFATLFLALYIFLISSYIFLRSSARDFFLHRPLLAFKSTIRGWQRMHPLSLVQFADSLLLFHFSSPRSTFDYQTFFPLRSPKLRIRAETLHLAPQFMSNLNFSLVAPPDTHVRPLRGAFYAGKMEQKSPSAPGFRITKTRLSRFLHAFLLQFFAARAVLVGLFHRHPRREAFGKGEEGRKNCVQYFLCSMPDAFSQ